ncbi:MAG: glycine zipper 2TM domain-containing protein [Novosphingobium sp.]
MRKSLIACCLIATVSFAAPVAADPPLYTFGGSAPANNAVAYDENGQYVTPQTLSTNDRVWMGEDGQYHCKRKNGTTGLVIGAAIGGFLGNRIAGRGKRTLGTIIGAVGGGLLGKSLTDGEVKCQ